MVSNLESVITFKEAVNTSWDVYRAAARNVITEAERNGTWQHFSAFDSNAVGRSWFNPRRWRGYDIATSYFNAEQKDSFRREVARLVERMPMEQRYETLAKMMKPESIFNGGILPSSWQTKKDRITMELAKREFTELHGADYMTKFGTAAAEEELAKRAASWANHIENGNALQRLGTAAYTKDLGPSRETLMNNKLTRGGKWAVGTGWNRGVTGPLKWIAGLGAAAVGVGVLARVASGAAGSGTETPRDAASRELRARGSLPPITPEQVHAQMEQMGAMPQEFAAADQQVYNPLLPPGVQPVEGNMVAAVGRGNGIAPEPNRQPLPSITDPSRIQDLGNPAFGMARP